MSPAATSEVGERRWFWQDEYDGTLSPGWALIGVAMVIVVVGAAVYWLNDMHMYRYGLYGSLRMVGTI